MLIAAALAVAAASTMGCRGSERAAAEWIEREAHFFEEEAQLEPLLQRSDGHRLILLGESTHGTEEFYEWRRRITQALVERGAIGFVAVEGDWPLLVELGAWARHAGPNADDEGAGRRIVAGFDRWPHWMWSNEQTLKLATWLREHNRDRPESERVGLYGLDLYSPERAIANAVEWLREHRAAALEGGDYACMIEVARAGRGHRQRVASGEGCEEELEALIAEVEALAIERGGELASRRDRHALLEALYGARQAERHFAADDASEGWNLRAGYFFEVAKRLLELYGDDRAGVVWAHNTHIGDGRATPMARRDQVNIGMLASQNLGEDQVFRVGFGTDAGEVLAARQWGAAVETMAIAPARDGSLGAYLREHGPAQAFWLLDDTPPRRLRRLPHRAIGVVWSGEDADGNYISSATADRYDAFVWIEESTALRPLR